MLYCMVIRMSQWQIRRLRRELYKTSKREKEKHSCYKKKVDIYVLLFGQRLWRFVWEDAKQRFLNQLNSLHVGVFKNKMAYLFKHMHGRLFYFTILTLKCFSQSFFVNSLKRCASWQLPGKNIKFENIQNVLKLGFIE